jgi:hypothetical protein
MADRNRRFTFAAITLPFLFLAMSGLARANNIFVNTTDGESDLAPLCSLPDAITAHNNQAIVNGCAAGSGLDTIFIDVTGTISIDETLEITNGIVDIVGPTFGCSGPGPCGITIDGEGNVQILKADPLTIVGLFDLTLADGHATTASPGTAFGTGTGGAIFADGSDLGIFECLLRNNSAQGTSLVGGLGGAIFGLTGDITIVNSTIANNSAVTGTSGSEGGAIWATSTMEITASTISGNTADAGGGYFNFPGPSLKGTIWSNNTNDNCDSTLATDLNYNISDDASCFFTAAKSLNSTNPDLDPDGLENNGGPTDTIALETFPSFSPAIGRIPVANCTDQNGFPLLTDQRLFPRPDKVSPFFCDSGAYEAFSVQPIVIVPNTERLQVARSTTAGKDQVNTAFTFIYNGDDSCDLGPGGDEDALNEGFSLSIFEGTCAALPANGLMLSLDPFVVHKVNSESYGTLFQSTGLQQPGETVSARLITLPTPKGACSAFALNLEVAGLNTAALGLGGGNPFAIVLTDSPMGQFSADASVCFDVTNAVVGSQTPAPPHGGVHRRVRRGR